MKQSSNVPAFLSKLWTLVEETHTNEFITWSQVESGIRWPRGCPCRTGWAGLGGSRGQRRRPARPPAPRADPRLCVSREPGPAGRLRSHGPRWGRGALVTVPPAGPGARNRPRSRAFCTLIPRRLLAAGAEVARGAAGGRVGERARVLSEEITSAAGIARPRVGGSFMVVRVKGKCTDSD